MSSVGVDPSVTWDPGGGGSPDDHLALHLATAPERWGWEFAPPAPVAPFTERAPVWCPPSQPDVRILRRRLDEARARMSWYVGLGVGVLCLGLTIAASGGSGGVLLVFFLLSVGSAGVGLARYVPARKSLGATGHVHAEREHSYREAFDQHEAAYRLRRATWERAEQHRVDSASLHFPLTLSRSASRVDVFGGDGRGWECLLTTVGCTALADGTAILCLDLSDQDVAGSLAEFAATVGAPVATGRAPEVFAGAGFLDHLDALELAELLAEALAASRPRPEADAMRPLDVDLLHAVTRRLDRPVDLRRVVAGLDVLRSVHEDNGPLSAEEVGRLAAAVDLVGVGERVREELRLLGAELSLVATNGSAPVRPVGELWSPHGLTVVRTDGSSRRAAAMSRRLLVQLAIEHLGRGRRRSQDAMLVVAGADEVGRDTVETLTRRASSAGVRLVLLFEHLREDARDLVGGADGATLFMRLGNPHEAEAAATFVGREHRFALSQISKSFGVNSSRSETTTRTGGSTVTETEGSSSGRSGLHYNSGQSYGTSSATSVSESLGSTFTVGSSETDGTVTQRSYEFSLEPTEFQQLRPSCFVLVDVGPGGRRVVAGDCHPALARAPRMGSRPRVQR